ncbi:hypothetical protein IFM89_031528 [Coptis chinensis]|uniref:Uncharacterized protein n=1 Tax=Coptis chinensis TaxID=261450 RepID=A0A835IGE3_9MAGN|nr:hypothetical protein IFM89_031528 [Coptis chinensis]
MLKIIPFWATFKFLAGCQCVDCDCDILCGVEQVWLAASRSIFEEFTGLGPCLKNIQCAFLGGLQIHWERVGDQILATIAGDKMIAVKLVYDLEGSFVLSKPNQGLRYVFVEYSLGTDDDVYSRDFQLDVKGAVVWMFMLLLISLLELKILKVITSTMLDNVVYRVFDIGMIAWAFQDARKCVSFLDFPLIL